MTFISVQPDDLKYWWEICVQLNNFKQWNIENYHILLFKPSSRKEWNPLWKQLENIHPNIKIFFYEDKHNIEILFKKTGYIPILRPYCLALHFEKYPELNKETIFYIDSDVIFTKQFPFEKFENDNICYLSKTDYINVNYFDNKQKQLNTPSILDELCFQSDISEEIFRQNNENTGGAQYILKNVNADFWMSVFRSCINIYTFLTKWNDINVKADSQEERQKLGYQAWCADMWAVLHNLWRTKHETRCPPEMNFSWANSLLSDEYIYHNAGITGNESIPFFNKNKMEYVNNSSTPFDDYIHLKQLCNNAELKQYNNIKYINQIINTIENEEQIKSLCTT